MGGGVLHVTLKHNVLPDSFVTHDVIEVNEKIRAVNLKPAGRREIIVNLRGLHPNTRDQGVLEYLSKFGKILSSKVIHCVYKDGPLMGLKNGDRNFKLEIKPGANIPSYHVLYGQKVTLRYSGQKQTCARCFKSSQYCMGGGIAKRCEAAGGDRVEFSQYVMDLWREIGYSPQEVEIASIYDNLEDTAESDLQFSVQ